MEEQEKTETKKVELSPGVYVIRPEKRHDLSFKALKSGAILVRVEPIVAKAYDLGVG